MPYATRVFGSTITYSPHYSNVDLAINKGQVVKAYNSSGVFLDMVRDAPYLSFQENINAAASAVRVTLPRAIDAFDGLYQPGSKNTVVLGNIWQWWLYGPGLPETGLLKYQGIIDDIAPKLEEGGGESVEVLVTPFSQVVGDHAVTSAVTFGTSGNASTYIDSAQMFKSFFTGSYVNHLGFETSVIDAVTSKPYGSPFTLDPASTAYTGNKAHFAFQDQSLVSALSDVVLLSPANYFFRLNQDKTVYFGQASTLPEHTLLLGQHISSIEYSQSNVPRKNHIKIKGNGVGGEYTGDSISTIGQRFYGKKDNRITDTTTAQLLANGIGAMLDREQVRAKVKVVDYRGDVRPGLGYDIETFRVGDSLKILDARAPQSSIVGSQARWDEAIWDVDKWGAGAATASLWDTAIWDQSLWTLETGSIFNTVVTIMSIQYEYFSVTLELGFKAPTLNRKIYELQSLFQETSLV